MWCFYISQTKMWKYSFSKSSLLFCTSTNKPSPMRRIEKWYKKVKLVHFPSTNSLILSLKFAQIFFTFFIQSIYDYFKNILLKTLIGFWIIYSSKFCHATQPIWHIYIYLIFDIHKMMTMMSKSYLKLTKTYKYIIIESTSVWKFK